MTPGPVFRIGSPDLGHEVVIDGERRFFWHVGPHDTRLAEVAGWSDLDATDEDDGIGSIKIPEDARSASSALGGMEARMGEKDQILGFVTKYANDVYKQFGAVDGSLSLDTVGVTRGNKKMFAVPPHNLMSVDNPAEYSGWYNALCTDLEDILMADPRKDELVARFRQDMPFAGEEV
ncbi:MAG TPA: hypothetical protein VLA92_01645 [Candidatus Saccharimonadales bacterium]|nr:hypothetical protein [Candidatus Saccharimonadales bacterium]